MLCYDLTLQVPYTWLTWSGNAATMLGSLGWRDKKAVSTLVADALYFLTTFLYPISFHRFSQLEIHGAQRQLPDPQNYFAEKLRGKTLTAVSCSQTSPTAKLQGKIFLTANSSQTTFLHEKTNYFWSHSLPFMAHSNLERISFIQKSIYTVNYPKDPQQNYIFNQKLAVILHQPLKRLDHEGWPLSPATRANLAHVTIKLKAEFRLNPRNMH